MYRDDFVPPLSEAKFHLYVTRALRFKEDFLKNIELNAKFNADLREAVREISKYLLKDKVVGLLVLLYLFQSAMDYHYYHFDYYLKDEDNPVSPMGWHFLRIRKIVAKMAKQNGIDNKENWAEEMVLKILSLKGEEIAKKTKNTQLISSCLDVHVYESVHQEQASKE